MDPQLQERFGALEPKATGPQLTGGMVALFLLPFAVLGLLLLLLGGISLWEYFDSQNWAQTTGSISHLEIREHYESGRSSCHCTMYYLDMTYSYSVAGRQYSSQRLDFNSEICLGSLCLGGQDRTSSYAYDRNPAIVQAAYEELRQQPGLRVYYDPDHPSHAVIRRSRPLLTFGMFIAGLGLLFVTLLLYSFQMQRIRARQAEWPA